MATRKPTTPVDEPQPEAAEPVASGEPEQPTPDDGQRTVKIGAISYATVDGGEALGLHGQIVQVHIDDRARFDRLNEPMPVPEESPLDEELLLELAARRGEPVEPDAAPEQDPRPDLRQG